MEPLSSLHLLTEAVRNAGADIAPTYQEYIQLAFAIATDCGEAGRQDFLALCSLSSKYDHRAAEQLFSNALKTGHNDVHIGTAFHLAELCGVKIEYENPGTVGTVGTEVRPPSGTHTRTRVKEVYSQEKNDFFVGQRSAVSSAHFRQEHPMALSPGTHHELRHLRCPERRPAAGSTQRFGSHHGAARPVRIRRKDGIALHADFHFGQLRIRKRSPVAGTPAGRTFSR